MLFSSLTFLLFFLPVVVLLYFLMPKFLKNAFLLTASLLFYAVGEPSMVFVMIGVILLSYLGALVIDKIKNRDIKFLTLNFTVFAGLGILIYYKYFGFILQNLPLKGFIDIPFFEIIMPIGISFYMFQAISYIMDVYRGETVAQKNPLKLALYISFFPQLIAGPIVKYHDIYRQIDNRCVEFNSFILGLKRFIIGLGKKVIIANTLGEVVDKIFALRVQELSPEIAWVGALFYAMQLYFDFSGYSDMAIGLGRMFGFKFLENFNFPYVAKSITDFWRRWHISLTTWFKEYVYIPLGGNRLGKAKTIRNLAVVFLLTGLWHGAGWNFIVWGLWHGAFIIFEKISGFMSSPKNMATKLFAHVYLLSVVIIGWVIFRAHDLTYARDFIKLMFNLYETHPSYTFFYYTTNWSWIIFAVAVLCASGLFKDKVLHPRGTFGAVLADIYLLGVFGFCLLALVGASYNPFIYFRF